MAKKAVDSIVKLNVKAGEANPAPPIGSVLGAKGVKIMDFCKSFNEKTKSVEKGTPLPVVITIYKDKSFEFIIKAPPASYLLLKAANVSSGSGMPNKKKVGKLNRQQLENVAAKKLVDLNTTSLEAAIRTLAGTARNMGIDIEVEDVE